MPLASKMLLQVAAQDISQLTDIDARVQRRAAPAGRLSTCYRNDVETCLQVDGWRLHLRNVSAAR
jgi:hypothetical protein